MHSILISGAAGGFGDQLTRLYVKLGYRVFATDMKKSDTVTELLKDYPLQYSFCAADVTKDEDIETLKRFVSERTDSLDILLNAVGILFAASRNPMEEMDFDVALKTIDINTLGPLRLIKALLPLLKAGEEKMIVNISSEAGSLKTHNNYVDRYDYCMSKAALNMGSVILQRYLAPTGLRVLLVHPGWMKTDMGGERAPLTPAVSAENIAALIQLKREEKSLTTDAMFFDYDGTPRAW